ncbi:hypothetical protein H8A92_03195 [Bradyrhizobium sp. 10BB]|nr:hypothetical protein [Bradyrhizobium acaciae]
MLESNGRFARHGIVHLLLAEGSHRGERCDEKARQDPQEVAQLADDVERAQSVLHEFGRDDRQREDRRQNNRQAEVELPFLGVSYPQILQWDQDPPHDFYPTKSLIFKMS